MARAYDINRPVVYVSETIDRTAEIRALYDTIADLQTALAKEQVLRQRAEQSARMMRFVLLHISIDRSKL